MGFNGYGMILGRKGGKEKEGIKESILNGFRSFVRATRTTACPCCTWGSRRNMLEAQIRSVTAGTSRAFKNF